LSEHKQKKWNLDPAPPEDQASAPAAPEFIDPPASGDELSKLLAEKQELMNTLVRRQADFENYRKRVEKERHADRHRGVESLIEHRASIEGAGSPVPPDLLRLSVSIEDPDDLLADLDAALTG
jgi:hypothetical protein